MKTTCLLLTLIFAGCSGKPEERKQQEIRSIYDDVFTVEHEGHQFVVYRGSQKGGIIHHPGCKCLSK